MISLKSDVEIQDRVKEISDEISQQYGELNQPPIVIGVLNGAFMFVADLVKYLSIDCEVDFIKISSYGSATTTSGTVRLIKDISADITGRHVIVVEDIVDTGLTLAFLRKRMLETNPKSLSIATFLLKPEIAKVDFEIDWIGFEIENKFVVGYGLDYDQKYRGLTSIHIYDE